MATGQPSYLQNSAPIQVRVVDQSPNIQGNGLHRHTNIIRGLGIAETVLGSLSALLGIISVAVSRNDCYYGYYYCGSVLNVTAQGIWCGIFIVATGILGIRVNSASSQCMYNANIIMAVITICTSLTSVVLSGLAAASYYQSVGVTIIHIAIAILTFSAFIILIIHLTYCCGKICSSSLSPTAQVAFVQQNHSGHPGLIQGTNGQLMVVSSPSAIPGNSQVAVATSCPPSTTQMQQRPPDYAESEQKHMKSNW